MEENTQKLSKRQQAKLAYMEKRADIAMQSICKSFGKDIPNHLVTAGYRWGFEEGCAWERNNPIGVLDEDYVWAIYNFVNEWKSGKYGEIELQKAIKDNFKF